MAERSLTRDQVDRLLQAIDSGEISLDEGPARPYPPRHVDLGPVRGVVERWVEDAARLLENWLILHVSNKMTCHFSGLVPRGGAVEAPPAALALIRCGDDDPILSVWDRDLVDGLVAGMLGYSFAVARPETDARRNLTEIDLRMLRRAVSGFTLALTNSWPRVDGRTFEAVEVGTDQASMTDAASSMPAMAGNVQIRVAGEVVGGIEFALPGWVGRELRSLADERETGDEGSPEMREVVGSLEVDVDVSVPVGQYTLRQILEMEVGEELVLPTPMRAILEASGLAFLEGVPGLVEGRWAVAVETRPEGEKNGGE